LADILKKVISQVGIRGREVNLSLPESATFTRVIKFPLLSDEEIASAVKWEAEQYIPIPVTEAVVQYNLLERNQQKAYVSVLLVAVPKNIVEKYMKVIKLAGLMPVVAETELTAISRSLSPEKGTHIVLDIGSSATNVGIVRDLNIVFARSIPVGGEAFTRAVSQYFNIDLAQAEEYKKTYGLQSNQLEGKVKASLEPICRVIIDEIKKAIHFYTTEIEGSETPKSIVITGGASSMPDIVSYLAENLGLETAIGNPFSKINIDEESNKKLLPFASLYGATVGLAMREE
jgi:type IV pilus assembly protein PilM